MSSKWAYKKGLVGLGSGVFAYLQPQGDWGWSNAGLISDSGQSLLVDTLFDLKLTRDMLQSMRRSVKAAEKISKVVNTHANGDHFFGNQLLDGAEIIATKTAAKEMVENAPKRLAQLLMGPYGPGVLGEYLKHCFSPFDFSGIEITPATKTFDKKLTVSVGTKKVQLLEVGPAHTGGDLLVYCEQERLLYSGDILFVDVTPVMWAGPISNWIQACEMILQLNVDAIVPGHGPISDKQGVQKLLDYLHFISKEARHCFDSGLSVQDATMEIALGRFSHWLDWERLAVNVNSLYREFSKTVSPLDVMGLFELMAQVRKNKKVS